MLLEKVETEVDDRLKTYRRGVFDLQPRVQRQSIPSKPSTLQRRMVLASLQRILRFRRAAGIMLGIKCWEMIHGMISKTLRGARLVILRACLLSSSTDLSPTYSSMSCNDSIEVL